MASTTLKKIFVGPTPATLTEQALVNYFRRFGTIDALELVDMSCLPSIPPNDTKAATHIFVHLHFYIVTFSSLITPLSLDELSKEWHSIDNHLLQVRQVELRPIVFEPTASEIIQPCTTTLTSLNQQAVISDYLTDDEPNTSESQINQQQEITIENIGDQNQINGKRVIAQKVTGIVKWFNVKNGFGIINQDNNNEEIFVHKSAIVKNSPGKFLPSLDINEKVEFDIVQGKKGYEAVNVTRSNSTNVPGPDGKANWRQNNTRGGSGAFRRGRTQSFRGRGRQSARGGYGHDANVDVNVEVPGGCKIDESEGGPPLMRRSRRSRFNPPRGGFRVRSGNRGRGRHVWPAHPNNSESTIEQQDNDQLLELQCEEEEEDSQCDFDERNSEFEQGSTCGTDDSTATYLINVRVRSTDDICQVDIVGSTMIGELIAIVCEKTGMNAPPDHYYLMFNGQELNLEDTIRESGIIDPIVASHESLPELRLKFVHQLKESSHISTHIVLTSPEELVYHEMLDVPFSPTQQEIMPEVLKSLAKQTVDHKLQSSAFSSKLISMPVFNKHVIDELPSIHITVPLKPNEFDWDEFLKYLAIDLDIQHSDMFLMSVEEGSTKYQIKFKAAISLCKEKMKKIAKKMTMIVLPSSKCAQFIADQKSTGDIKELPKIEAILNNFSEDADPTASKILTPDEIDAALGFMQRPAIIDQPAWEYLTEKSRNVSTCILHAFQTSTMEFVIESMALVHNEELYHKYTKSAVRGEETILFHGTKTANLDGIFEMNFKNFHTTDAGWYGQGMYFSSSPKYCGSYAGSSASGVMYLICSLIKLGNVYHVKDMSFNGKPMRADSDTHYVKVTAGGSPTNAESSFFEEFVIKKSDQILPLYIIGLRNVHRFVLWRDAKITDSHNGDLFAQMKGRYNFNIYGTETSAEALAILKCKLADTTMRCVVVTNGGDAGEMFARECRKLQVSMPIIVYCMSVAYHQQWAAAASGVGQPQIQVTGNSNDVFEFINTNFPSGST